MIDKAQRAEIQLGSHTIEGFMLPDGSYVLSQTQAAEIVGLKGQNISDFLRSKALKVLLGEGYTPQIAEVEPEADQVREPSQIRGLPLDVVAVYWMWQSLRGNKSALALAIALVIETLESRFDAAFNISWSNAEQNQSLSDRLSSRASEVISLLIEEDQELRRENEEMRQRLTDLGDDPYRLPGDGGGDSSDYYG